MAEPYRADQVGSFLRPPELLQARADFHAGRLAPEQLTAAEDAAILRVLEMQQQAGIDVFSDGEYRRTGWSSDFADSVDGYVEGRPAVAVQFQGGAAPAAPRPSAGTGRGVIGERLRQRRRLTEHESAFLKQHAPGPFKITMPAPSYIVARGFAPGVTDRVYSSRKELLADVAAIIAAEVKALVNEGVRYVQLDNPHYPDYVDGDRQAQWQALGIDPQQALQDDIEADNAAIAGIDREATGVTFGMHFCRGNGANGAWHTSGGYDAIAKAVFQGLQVDRLLLEYDSDRAGSFDPLRHVSNEKTVVLGLITTKAGALESPGDVVRRIEEASKYVPLERLTLSPQCGFASVMSGNPLSWDEQRRKLGLVVETARTVWK